MDVANLAELATSLCCQDLRFKGWWLVAGGPVASCCLPNILVVS